MRKYNPANRKHGAADGPAVVIVVFLALSILSPLFAEEDADRLFDKAMSSYKMERWEEASTRFYDFMAAAPDDPRNDRAQFYAARAYHKRKYLNKAIEEYEYMLEDFPRSTYAHLARYYLGRALIGSREKEEGHQQVFQYVKNYRPKWKHRHSDEEVKKELHDTHRRGVMDVADYFLERDEHEKAIAAYMRLPRELEAFRRVVNVRYDLGQYDRILEMIEGLEDRNQHEAFKYMMEFYGEKNAYRRLRDVFRELLGKDNPDDKTDELVWHAQKMMDKFGDERREEALDMISDHYPRLARRAEYELAKRNRNNHGYLDKLELFVIRYRDEGRRNIRVRNQYRLNDVDRVLRWRGLLHERAGEADEARNEYGRMSNAGQGHWFTAETYHNKHADEKDREAAIEEYDALRRAFYSEYWSAMAQWRMAELLKAMEKYDEAAEAYRQFHERWPDLRIRHSGENRDRELSGMLHYNMNRKNLVFAPEALLACGDMLRDAGRYDDAIMEYRSLVENYPKSDQAPWGIYRTALCFEQKDDSERAVEVFKSLLRQYGKSRAAADASERLQQKYDIADPYVEDAMDFSDVIE